MSTGQQDGSEYIPPSPEDDEAAAAEIARVVAEARRKAGLAPAPASEPEPEPEVEVTEVPPEPEPEPEPEVEVAEVPPEPEPEPEPEVEVIEVPPEPEPESEPEPELAAVPTEPETEPEPELASEPALPVFDLEGYVLQVGAYREYDVALFNAEEIDREQIVIVPINRKGEDWFVLLYGNYSSYQEALEAGEKFALDYPRESYWARNTAGIRKVLRPVSTDAR
jgi:septal ring-binding cell division protein DamX